jgi:hypothetical protein
MREPAAWARHTAPDAKSQGHPKVRRKLPRMCGYSREREGGGRGGEGGKRVDGKERESGERRAESGWKREACKWGRVSGAGGWPQHVPRGPCRSAGRGLSEGDPTLQGSALHYGG